MAFSVSTKRSPALTGPGQYLKGRLRLCVTESCCVAQLLLPGTRINMCTTTPGLGNFHDVILCFHLCASMMIALTDFKFFVFVAAVVLFWGFLLLILLFVVVLDVAFCLFVLRTHGRSGWKPLNCETWKEEWREGSNLQTFQSLVCCSLSVVKAPAKPGSFPDDFLGAHSKSS